MQPRSPIPGHPYRSVPDGAVGDPYRTRKMVGLVLWFVGQGAGLVLLILLFAVLPLFQANPLQAFFGMAVGATLAFPAMVVYLTFPRLLDRYDPEPVYALALCLLWGAVAACGFSALINSVIGEGAGMLATSLAGPEAGMQAAEVVGAVISAPIVEEAWKGFAVLGVFYFLRNEFDGVVDGIIYATFTAIGFAATENVIYYARALTEDPAALAFTFVLRGVIAPWGHPLYTSMTGIGFGLARESHRTWVKVLAPLAGYAGAVFLHALWNGSATLADGMGAPGLFLLMLPLWIVFVTAFVIMVMVLVVRRGRIIREHLLDEVALGHLTQRELDLVCSAFGGLVAWFRKGSRGTEFVRAVARLGLSKWHTARAIRGQNKTFSMDFILPLRARIRELRQQGAAPA
ncbi:MAG: PrsW family intramembrane metalloprotease [Myxococcota bacterium]|nr:PrsW family intramembrane metalloprotease [Myxococcota bacterium]